MTWSTKTVLLFPEECLDLTSALPVSWFFLPLLAAAEAISETSQKKSQTIKIYLKSKETKTPCEYLMIFTFVILALIVCVNGVFFKKGQLVTAMKAYTGKGH